LYSSTRIWHSRRISGGGENARQEEIKIADDIERIILDLFLKRAFGYTIFLEVSYALISGLSLIAVQQTLLCSNNIDIDLIAHQTLL